MRTVAILSLLVMACGSATDGAAPVSETGGSSSSAAEATGGQSSISTTQSATGGSATVASATGRQLATGGLAATGGNRATGGASVGPYAGSPESHDNGFSCDYSTIHPSVCRLVGGTFIAVDGTVSYLDPIPCTDPCLPNCVVSDSQTKQGSCSKS